MEPTLNIKVPEKSSFLEKELDWVTGVLNHRLKLYFGQDNAEGSIYQFTPPSPEKEKKEDKYCQFIFRYGMDFDDRLCLILSLVPVIRPQLLDCLQIKNADTDQRFVEFGCIRGNYSHGLLPTLETVLFVLAGDDIPTRLKAIDRFSHSHFLFRLKYLLLETPPWPEPPTSAVLAPSAELMEQLIKGKEYTPEFSHSFPAQTLTTKQTWEDLILDQELMTQINEIKIWVEYGDKVLYQWGLDSRMKPGYKCLFYGPSGTGKTFTTILLGKDTGKKVFRVDLSMVVSKYIGETEKNLSGIFDTAERMDVILFFDEADALFGKRTQVKDAHDRYANLETSYLLQRIEDYNGLVILASNLKSNIDDAFARRFQTVIHFTMPNPEQRRLIWRNTFSPKTELEKLVNIDEIAEKYELSGGSILNVVRYCSVMAMSRNSNIIKYDDLLNGIKKEFHKEGKTV